MNPLKFSSSYRLVTKNQPQLEQVSKALTQAFRQRQLDARVVQDQNEQHFLVTSTLPGDTFQRVRELDIIEHELTQLHRREKTPVTQAKLALGGVRKALLWEQAPSLHFNF